jgi:flagellar motor switch protein FliG
LLSDVETAQQRLAEVANELVSQGEITVQMKRHLLTMA